MKKHRVLVPAVFVFSGLQGCTIVDTHTRIPDWPHLEVLEHHVDSAELRERCMPFTPLLALPNGCTVIDFDEAQARIYVSKDFPDPSVLEHERLHARGYDHIGSTYLRRAWEAWKLRSWWASAM